MSNGRQTFRVRQSWRWVTGASFALLFALSAQAASLKSCDPGAFERLRDETLIPLFDALRSGDLDGIKRHLSASRASEYAVLFEKNATYGQYLRDYYEGSSFEIVDVQGRGRDFEAIVMIYWPDGRSAEVVLEFDKPRGDLAAAVAPGRQCSAAR